MTRTPPRPFALVDRDGTIIVERHYLHDPGLVTLERNAAAGLAALRAQGYGLVVVTNQAGIGKGLYTTDQMHACNARMQHLLAAEGVTLDGIYFCPDPDGMQSPCRKPMPGMALQAAAEHGIALGNSVVIGDKAIDVGLARAVGSRAILVRTGYGAREAAACAPDYVADDLCEAAAWLGRQQLSSKP